MNGKNAKEQTEKYYNDIKKLINLIKKDKRFKITSYSELANKVRKEGERKIKKSDIKLLKNSLSKDFSPVTEPVSLSIFDILLACRDFILGDEYLSKRLKLQAWTMRFMK